MKNEEFLAALETELNRQMDYVVSELQNKHNEALLHTPAPQMWNAAQCIDHLNTYAQYYLPLIEAKIKDPSPNPLAKKEFNPGAFSNYLIHQVHPRKGNKKLSAHPRHIPQLQDAPGEIVQTFITHQERFLQLLRQSGAINLMGHKIPISINRWIKLSIGNIYRFLIFHNARHLQQASIAIQKFEGEDHHPAYQYKSQL